VYLHGYVITINAVSLH